MSNQTIRYVVVNEHTLGYVYGEQPRTLNILRASVLRGAGEPDPLRAQTPLNASDTVRLATLQDFADFKVQPPAL